VSATDARPAPEVTGATRVHVLIGDPVGQVRSPALYNRLCAAHGIDAIFVPLAIPAARFAEGVAGLRALANLAGIVVTIPHKSAMLDEVDEASTRARMIGAVNAIRVEPDGRWVGDAFDGVGYVEGLRANGHDPAGKSVQLVGAGGAGSSMAFALAEAGVARLRIHDPVASRVKRVAAGLAERHPDVIVEVGAVDPAGVDIVANATPLGMTDGDPLPVDPACIKPTQLVTDMIMKPPVTPLLRAAAARGCPTVPGLAALEGQAAVNMRFFALT